MQTVLITGGTGLVGTALALYLAKNNYSVIILTRNSKNVLKEANISYALWSINDNTIDIASFQKADAIIHLAGAGVMDKKWTASYKKEIEESRTKSSLLLVHTLKNYSHKVKTIISTSAIGWYGADKLPSTFFTETDTVDKSFLGAVCYNWEQSITPATTMDIRLCILRLGIVLSNKGGAYVAFKKSLRYGIASILGSGSQIISWIHINDLCRQFLFALENKNLNGVYNAVAPLPISNKALILTIAKAIRNTFYLTINIPTFVLKIILGKRSIEVLKSTTVSSAKIKSEGFTFLYPSIESAINELEKK
ncbi:MAG: TIGR01777 family oxidoreductase [Ferruginibacter sp.]|nr:TIGR01777 family protein [Ferruginibacter sp.]